MEASVDRGLVAITAGYLRQDRQRLRGMLRIGEVLRAFVMPVSSSSSAHCQEPAGEEAGVTTTSLPGIEDSRPPSLPWKMKGRWSGDHHQPSSSPKPRSRQNVNIAMTITMPTNVCSNTTAMAVTAKITKKTTRVGIPRTWANSSSNAVASICS